LQKLVIQFQELVESRAELETFEQLPEQNLLMAGARVSVIMDQQYQLAVLPRDVPANLTKLFDESTPQSRP
jgi:hypothetical protein